MEKDRRRINKERSKSKKRLKNESEIDRLEHLEQMIHRLEDEGQLNLERKFMQHGHTSVYEHSLKVAYTSLYLASKLHLKIDERSLLKGALLHDYFLYDWHEKDKSHRLHGFKHAKTALRNARKDYRLNEREEDIIGKHMFPLNPVPPKYKESWLVCLGDKYCAAVETLQPLFRRKR